MFLGKVSQVERTPSIAKLREKSNYVILITCFSLYSILYTKVSSVYL